MFFIGLIDHLDYIALHEMSFAFPNKNMLNSPFEMNLMLSLLAFHYFTFCWFPNKFTKFVDPKTSNAEAF